MPLKFKTSMRKVGFLDPFSDFKPKHFEVEVRTDPLTGDIARVLEWRARSLGPIDHSVLLERKLPFPCPFCPDNLGKMAARFLPQDVPEGHLSLGEAVCFPNAFPYEAVNGVIVLSKAHYLEPAQFTSEMFTNAFLLARTAFKRLAKEMSFASVNWNYMMPAGAGLIHPHFQIAAGKGPTKFQAELQRRARAYGKKSPGADIAQAYLDEARKDNQRWLGRVGPAAWVVPFAPRAVYDIMALIPGGRGLMDLNPGQVDKLSQGMTRVLGFFQKKGVAAFNMALHTPLVAGTGMPAMLRLVSRVEIPPMGVDEINYFEKLHDEMITFLRPEKLAAEIRAGWK